MSAQCELVNAKPEPALLNSWMRFNLYAIKTTVWISAGLFGLYIFSGYLGYLVGTNDEWNQRLLDLDGGRGAVSSSVIALHFLAGGIILLLGFVQFSTRVRNRWLHRVLGRVYVLATLLAGIGGLVFIVTHGTIGGSIMDAGFAGYGILMITAAIQTIRYARQRELLKHQVWALRLFSLAIASWLYRMEYGFWFFLTNGLGHTKDFHGYFDQFMVFFFYLPNWYIAGIVAKNQARPRSNAYLLIASNGLALLNGLIIIGTYVFFTHKWWAAIIKIFAP